MPPAGSAQRPVDPRHLVAAVGVAAAIVLVASEGTWRLALLTAGAALAVALTRMRYALPLALVLLAVVAVLTVADRTAGGDERSASARSGDPRERRAAPQTASERRHRARDRDRRAP